MFVGLHALLAERTSTPELAISLDEGAAFMTAAQKVMRHYSVETTQKTLDIVAFMGTTAGIYMPRVAVIMMRHKAEQEHARQAQQAERTMSPFQFVPEAA